jgi:hypothetical protein
MRGRGGRLGDGDDRPAAEVRDCRAQ